MASMTMMLIDARYHGPEPTPELLRRRGVQRAVSCDIGLEHGHPNAERDGRAALRDLVDAFLQDRPRNADLFYLAHVLGRRLSTTVNCRWTPGKESYTLECPIYALHRKFAHSIAITVTTECSICGAGALGCEHIPGDIYEDVICSSAVTKIASFGHVAFTADPDFTYTWHQSQRVPVASLIKNGIIETPGDNAYCTHCQTCDGCTTDDDLDPVGRFERLIAEHTTNETAR
jgi:hypothetical protein